MYLWIKVKTTPPPQLSSAYLDRANNNRKETMVLLAEKFISRFLLHALPRGFCKIRHYGFLSTRVKQNCLSQIRVSLKMKEQGVKPKPTIKEVLRITKGIDPDLCPECGQGTLICIQELPRLRGSPNHRKCS